MAIAKLTTVIDEVHGAIDSYKDGQANQMRLICRFCDYGERWYAEDGSKLHQLYYYHFHEGAWSDGATRNREMIKAAQRMAHDIERICGHPEEYAIYLDRDNMAARTFKPGLRVEVKTMYVWPAMTGIGVINATYAEDGAVYSYAGNKVSRYGKMSNYGVEYTDNDRPVPLDEALEKARARGKKGVIRVTGDGYEVLKTGE